MPLTKDEIRLRKLYASGLKFLTPLTPEETYKIITDEAVKLVNALYGSLFVKKGASLERTYATEKWLFEIKIRKWGYTYKSSETKTPSVIDTKRVEKAHPQIIDRGIKSTIFIPLFYKKESLGVLSLDLAEKKHLAKKQVDLLKIFASFASISVKKALLYQEVTEAVEQRDLFISLASHEIKNPLTTIYLYSKILERRLKKPENKKFASVILWETERLNLLVNELLQIDRIKHGGFNYKFQNENLREIVKRAITNFKTRHRESKLIITDECKKDTVYADFDKIVQVIANLLDNAAKFSDKNSPVRLTLKDEKNCIIISVKDEGEGIDTKDIPHIFEKFYSGKASRQGMGLGLFLVKSIVSAHKGTIRVESEKNKGATFEVKLPRYENVKRKTAIPG